MEYSSFKLPDALQLLNELDKIAVEPEIWLSEEECLLLKNSAGLAVVCHENRQVVAAAYYLPAEELAEEFEDADPLFHPSNDEVYIYSVVVHPSYRRQGIGTELRRQLCHYAKEEGFVLGSTHVRKLRCWDQAAKKFYQPTDQRTVADYWEGSDSPDVEYMRFTLA